MHVLNLKRAKENLQRLGNSLRISMSDFTVFFGPFLAKNTDVITEQDFVDLVSKYEDELL